LGGKSYMERSGRHRLSWYIWRELKYHECHRWTSDSLNLFRGSLTMIPRTRRIQGILALVVTTLVTGASIARSDDDRTAKAATAASARSSKSRDSLDARCIDGSVVKIVLLDPKIPMKTDYGLFEIAVGDIRRIEFASRIPQSMDDQVKAAIARLG